jgi:hypothetical protein
MLMYNRWRKHGRSFDLGRLTIKDLCGAYSTHPAGLLYLLPACLSGLLKALHLMHHFHDEKGNDGITSFAVDRMLGTDYASARERPRSPQVVNLGYDVAEARRFPWVARLSGQLPRQSPPRAREAD